MTLDGAPRGPRPPAATSGRGGAARASGSPLIERDRARRPARPRRRGLSRPRRSCARSPARAGARSSSSTPPRASRRASRTARCWRRCRTWCSTAGSSRRRRVGADEVIVCVCESARRGHREHRATRSKNATRPPSARRSVRLATVPGHYVAGQESALVNYLNGGPAKPTFTPPMPFEQGVRRRPTLVNNAETLAHVALIARHGAQWFRQLGTPSQPGSALVTLSGPVAHPGVYEIEHGASLSLADRAAGGRTAHVHGALLGGYAGTWIGGELLARRRAVGRTPRAARRLARRRRRAAALRGRLPSRRDRPRRALARRPEHSASAGRACTAWTRSPGDRGGRRRHAGAQRQAARRAPGALRAPARRLRAIPTEPSTSSSARWRASPQSSPTTPDTGHATPARARRSCRCRHIPSARKPHAGCRRTDEPSRARQPDRLRGARHVRGAAARADHARRVGLSDRRRDAAAGLAGRARHPRGAGVPHVRAAGGARPHAKRAACSSRRPSRLKSSTGLS